MNFSSDHKRMNQEKLTPVNGEEETFFLCEPVSTTDSDSFLCSLTPDGFSLIHRPCSTGIGGGVGFFIRESYKYRKVDTQIIFPLKILSYQFQFQAELCS